jgi:hypothetical protein
MPNPHLHCRTCSIAGLPNGDAPTVSGIRELFEHTNAPRQFVSLMLVPSMASMPLNTNMRSRNLLAPQGLQVASTAPR